MLFACMAMCETEEEKTKFEAIYKKYKQLMYFIARGIIHNEQDVEDILQECFIKIFANLKKINKVMCSETRNFIVIIVKHSCLDFLRKKGRMVDEVDIDDLDEKYVPQIRKNEVPVESLINKEGYELLLKKAEQLSEIQKSVIVLKCANGYSTREIAEILDITVKEVENHIYRGKKRLRELITNELEAKI